VIFATLALLQVAVWAYFAVVLTGPNEWPSPQLLVMALTCVLVATAESLPSSRQRLVGALRVVAVCVPVVMLVHLAVAPAFYL
jgi:hypothetical protein